MQVILLTSSGHFARGFTQSTDEKSLDILLSNCISHPDISPANELFKSFGKAMKADPLPEVYVKKTVEATDEERAEGAIMAIQTSLEHNSKKIVHAGGAVTTKISKVGVCNSLGTRAFHQFTGASFISVNIAQDDDGSTAIGYASKTSNDFGELNFAEIAMQASTDAVSGLHPRPIPIGKYDIVFQAEAASDWLGSFVQLGFSVRRQAKYVELGSQCANEALNVVDDPRNTDTLMASPFDSEGTPTRKIELIKEGVAVAQCYDRRLAAKEGRESTGHALPIPDLSYHSFFPGWNVYYPMNQIVIPSDASADEIVRDSKRSIIVQRLMYARLHQAVSQGDFMQAYTMGTKFVDGGEVKHALPTLRISESLSKMSRKLSVIGDKKTVKKIGCIYMPWAKIDDVTISEVSSLAVPEGVWGPVKSMPTTLLRSLLFL